MGQGGRGSLLSQSVSEAKSEFSGFLSLSESPALLPPAWEQVAVHPVTHGLRFGDELPFQGRQPVLQGEGEAWGALTSMRMLEGPLMAAFAIKKEAKPITTVLNCSLQPDLGVSGQCKSHQS